MQLLIDDAEKIESISLRTGALSDAEFETIWDRYPDYRVELSADGEVIILPPCGLETAHRNCKITQLLANWAENDGGGLAFDSSAYYYLPTGARLSPDASWIRSSRIPTGNRARPCSISPDFVIELRSESDQMPRLRSKM
jgi:Uma2 family endonuclease